MAKADLDQLTYPTFIYLHPVKVFSQLNPGEDYWDVIARNKPKSKKSSKKRMTDAEIYAEVEVIERKARKLELQKVPTKAAAQKRLRELNKLMERLDVLDAMLNEND